MSFNVHECMHFWTVIPMFQPASGDAVADNGRVMYSRTKRDAMDIGNALMASDKWDNREYYQCLILPPLKDMLAAPESGMFMLVPESRFQVTA